jgi:DNA mismatch repair ATPase MutS
LEKDNENDVLNQKEIDGLNKIAKKSFWLSMSIDISNELISFLFSIIEIFKAFFLIDTILFNKTASLFNKQIDTLRKVYTFVGNIDAAISIAILKIENPNHAIPVFIKKKRIKIIEAYHPLIEQCKKNTIDTSVNCIITGGNMSGKTTFLKTVGLNAILAQTINFVFADSYECPSFKIHSSITNEDSISEGKSFFMDELLMVRELLNNLNKESFHLIIIDEIFRGTNSKDRVALASSILHYIAKENSLVFVSTHDLKIVKYINNQYDSYYFDNEFIENKVIFDYKLRRGNQHNTNVLELLKALDFPKKIIDDTLVFREFEIINKIRK